MPDGTAPGPIAGLCGTTVLEGSMVTPADVPSHAEWDGVRLDTPLWNDVLDPDPAVGTKVLAWYAAGRFEGTPVLTGRTVGAGQVYVRRGIQ